jgi:hypothetical protein
MKFETEKAYPVLDRTPAVIYSLLQGLDEQWIINNEGPETFSPFDVVGHLIHGEKTDWPNRIQLILEQGTSSPFIPYDRFAMYRESEGKTLDQLLKNFEALRKKNMEWMRSLNLSEQDLIKRGVHPNLGEVTMSQLISAWVVHDLTHIAQISRVMAKQYKEAIGPWVEFFRVLNF